MSTPVVRSTVPGMRMRTRTLAWLRHNLFRSKLDAVVTPISALIVGYLLYRAIRFVLVTGRWEIVRENLTLFLVGPYPRDEVWRPAVAVIAVAGYGGLLAGVIHVRQAFARGTGVDDGDDTGDDGRGDDHRSVRFNAQRVSDLVRRLWPLLHRRRRAARARHHPRSVAGRRGHARGRDPRPVGRRPAPAAVARSCPGGAACSARSA